MFRGHSGADRLAAHLLCRIGGEFYAPFPDPGGTGVHFRISGSDGAFRDHIGRSISGSLSWNSPRLCDGSAHGPVRTAL